MTRSATPALTALAAALCLAGPAAAQPGQTSEGAQRQMTGQSTGAKQAGADTARAPAPAKLAREDRDFLEKAAHAGHTEVEGSKLALTKATSPEVKEFAQQMVDDHTKAADELKRLAEAKGVNLPTEPALAQKAKLKVLSARSGDGFDRDYAEEVGVKAHGDTVRLFQKAAQGAQDADVKSFAQKTLPTLQRHLQMAQALHTTMSARAATPGSRATTSGSGTAGSYATPGASAPASGK
jgi:putative membrane protein